MKRTGTLMALAIALGATQIEAQQVSQTEAQSRAAAFLQQQLGEEASSVSLTHAHTSQRASDQRALYYVFNCGSGQGYVIVGGDESVRPILGYCNHGSFDSDQLPDNFGWWLSQYDAQISAAIDQSTTSGQQGAGSQRAAAATDRTDIGPLIQTKWGQGVPYSNYLNGMARTAAEAKAEENGKTLRDDYGLNFVIGSTGTAMAQVMKYYNYPEQGSGNYITGQFDFSVYCDDDSELSATFEPMFDASDCHCYDWDNMQILDDKTVDSYSGDYTTEQADAVARLMYDAGVTTVTTFSSADNGSYGVSSRIPDALVTLFGYARSISWEQRKYYTDAAWEAMIYNELANSRPVPYGGPRVGDNDHAFICDGYSASTGLFAFNWGSGSQCDGYYAITAPNAQLTNEATTVGSQSIAIGVKPTDSDGNEQPNLAEKNANSISLTVGGSAVTTYSYNIAKGKQEACLKTTVQNLCIGLAEFTMGVRAYDSNTGNVHFWTCQDITVDYRCNGLMYSKDVELTIDLHELESTGTYELRPVCRRRDSDSNSEADWTLVKTFVDDTYPVLTVTNQPKATPVVSISQQIITKTGWAQITVEGYTGSEPIRYSSSSSLTVKISTDGKVTAYDNKRSGRTKITVQVPETETTFGVTKVFPFEVSPYNIVIVGQPYMTNVAEDDYGNILRLHVPIADISQDDPTEMPQPHQEHFGWEISIQGSRTGRGGCDINMMPGDEQLFDIDVENTGFTDGETVAVTFFRDNNYSYQANVPRYTFTYHTTVPAYTLTSAGWGTITMPIDAVLPTGNDWKFYRCEGVVDDELQLLEETEMLHRNTPYIVSGTPGTASFTAAEGTTSEWVNSRLLMTDGLLAGVLADDAYTFEEGDYILQKHEGEAAAFYPITADSPKLGASATALRAFLRLPASSGAALRLPAQDEEGITTVGCEASGVRSGFDLFGRQVRQGHTGLQIRDGKVICTANDY